MKRQLYGKYGVAEYWVVDSDNHQVEVYRLQDRRLENAGTFKNSDEIDTPLLPSFKLTASTIFNS